MFATQTGPFPPSFPTPGPDVFDPSLLTRALAEPAGSTETLLHRLLAAVHKSTRAGAARCWLRSPGAPPFVAAECGAPIPLTEPLATSAITATSRPAGAPAWSVFCAQDLEPHAAAAWACQHSYATVALLSLQLGGVDYGRIELFLSQPPMPAALEGLARYAPWLALAAAHVDGHRQTRTAHDFIQQVLHHSPSAIIASDTSGRVRLWSPAAERMFGPVTADSASQVVRTVPAERRGEYDQIRQYVLAGKPLSNVDTVRQRADGTPLSVKLSAAPQRDADGATIGMIEILSDQSVERRVSRQLHVERRVLEILEFADTIEQAAAAVLQTLCEGLGWGRGDLWLLDAEKQLLERAAGWSRTAADSSRSPSSSRGCRRGEGLPGATWESGEATYLAALDDVVSGPAATLTREAGFGLPIHYRRQIVGVLTFRDVLLEDPAAEVRQALEVVAAMLGQFVQQKHAETALADASAKLRQSQKMDAVGLLASGIAHDFNNVLTVILSYSEIAAEDVPADDPVHDMLVEIHNAGRRAASMTRRLLTFTRQHGESIALLNLNQMVTETDRMMRRLIGPSIDLHTALEPTLGAIRGDTSQIDQLLVNFVVNARDAMSEGTGHGRGGSITISTSHVTLSSADAHNRPGARAGDFVVLGVRDTGCGMDEATKQRIFEPFFTTKGIGRGTGMGLATVAGIVRQSGAFIEVDSTPGVGTEMRVYFPRVNHVPATSAFDDRPEPIPGGRETIVVVEDDEILRTLVHRIIEVRGYTVLEARDAAEAVQVVQQSRRPVSLVLTGVALRGDTAEGLAAKLRKISPQTRVIYVVDGGGDDEPLAPLTEARETLFKPFTSERLARKIRAVLDS